MIFTLHTKTKCPMCNEAKTFLRQHEIPFQEIIYNTDDASYERLKNKLVLKTNFMYFPQIFFGETFIGSYKELLVQYNTGKLQDMLKSDKNTTKN